MIRAGAPTVATYPTRLCLFNDRDRPTLGIKQRNRGRCPRHDRSWRRGDRARRGDRSAGPRFCPSHRRRFHPGCLRRQNGGEERGPATATPARARQRRPTHLANGRHRTFGEQAPLLQVDQERLRGPGRGLPGVKSPVLIGALSEAEYLENEDPLFSPAGTAVSASTWKHGIPKRLTYRQGVSFPGARTLLFNEARRALR